MLGLRNHNGVQIDLFQGDITQFVCDIMVNAANSELKGGGGVDGAIHSAGGPTIIEELNANFQGCDTGKVVATSAGNLPCKKIAHAVGPIWNGGTSGEGELLASAYSAAFDLADGENCRHVASAAISTGIYGYPLQAAAKIAINSAVNFAATSPKSVKRITFVLFSSEIYKEFQEQLFAAIPEI